jgi:hypothetical protein
MLGLVAVWFTVLRPKPVESTPAPAPAPAQSATATPSAPKADATPAAPAKGAAAASRPDSAALAGIAPGDRSKPIIRALSDGKVVVLLFWEEAGADDRAARRALAAADRHDGKVLVKTAAVGDVGRYEAITKGAKVLSSPTALVIGPDRSARPIVGYTTTAELDDAVGDALAARR